MERNRIFAVIDTNVLVSALLSAKRDSNPGKVLTAVIEGVITPLYNHEIIAEYRAVLERRKFSFLPEDVKNLLRFFTHLGQSLNRVHTEMVWPDPKDAVFYEVSLSKKGSFLVTGNKKHFPVESRIVSPAEMVEICGL